MSRLISGQIRDGVIVADDLARLPEGLTVDVVIPDDEAVALSVRDEDELVNRLAEADRGDAFAAAEEVLRDLLARRAPHGG